MPSIHTTAAYREAYDGGIEPLIYEPEDLQSLDDNPRQMDDAVAAARAERRQGINDIWMVVGYDGVHVATLWSQPRGPGQVANYNHAEHIFFEKGVMEELWVIFLESFGRLPQRMHLVLKHSPCHHPNLDSCSSLVMRERQLMPHIPIHVEYDVVHGRPGMQRQNSLLGIFQMLEPNLVTGGRQDSPFAADDWLMR
ncbi:MAG TPA: hypothetical protein VF584_14665 [Longimicrobium sp.]|jgi:transposase